MENKQLLKASSPGKQLGTVQVSDYSGGIEALESNSLQIPGQYNWWRGTKS